MAGNTGTVKSASSSFPRRVWKAIFQLADEIDIPKDPEASDNSVWIGIVSLMVFLYLVHLIAG